MLRSLLLVVTVATAVLLGAPAMAQTASGGNAPLLQDSAAGDCPKPVGFMHVLRNQPLPQYKPDEEITPAVDEFHCSGKNAYDGDEQAQAEGKTLFRLCATCHGTNAEGRIGPSLVDETVKYERVATDHGEFEVIYGGAAGAMQPMGRRFTQDEILKIMTYVESLSAH
jgi:cytochrome c(L)